MPKITVPDVEEPAAKVRVTRRRVLFGTAGLLGLSTAAVATATYAGAVEAQGLVVTRYALNPSNWPAGRRLSITVIADLHAGGPDMTRPYVRHVVDTANQLKSDIVVLLGDYIATYRFAYTRIPYPVWAAELARLQAPLGTWRSSVITIGGTTLPASGARSFKRGFPCLKMTP